MTKNHVGCTIYIYGIVATALVFGLCQSLNSLTFGIWFETSLISKIVAVIMLVYGVFYFALPRPKPVSQANPVINDPFADRAKIDNALTAAANHIRAGRYTEARAVLALIKGDPKADEWLKTLSDPKYK